MQRFEKEQKNKIDLDDISYNSDFKWEVRCLHELIHFKYHNHSEKFYLMVSSLMLDLGKRQSKLDEQCFVNSKMNQLIRMRLLTKSRIRLFDFE